MFLSRQGRLVVGRGLSCISQSEGLRIEERVRGRRRVETLILPIMSFLTGVNAIEPSTSAHFVSLAFFNGMNAAQEVVAHRKVL